MEKRIGVVGIVIDAPRIAAAQVNRILSNHASIIVGRMGVPRRDISVAVIALIVEGTTDQVGALTGQLGSLPGVVVKSALTAKKVDTSDA